MNRPKSQLVGTPQRVGDHCVQAYQNLLTGKVAYDTINVPGGLPATYTHSRKSATRRRASSCMPYLTTGMETRGKLKLIASTKGIGDGTDAVCDWR